MHELLLILHSWVRWAVVITAVLAFGQALRGWLGKREWGELDNRLGLFYTVALDVQVLIGILLYIASPLTQAAFENFSAAMSTVGIRFFAVEHVALMIVAAALAHMGRAFSRRAVDAPARHKRAAIFFGLSILVILLAIPWPFREAVISRPWLRLP